ncbi:rod shape-determining protein [Natronocalculus amylovorans]|uniref:Rod shape-determining protein n=1 Tax=Natronocalculus amylovorans TaxID=2917812 RepID=A0AAE3FUY9_9EURY|nr:rod shape-determining protein [Natronocalculus amylovorans]MCL9815433.1 rod shape-determining protein [Natronocalculus amylovorans]
MTETESDAFDGSSTSSDDPTPVGVKLGSTRTVIQIERNGEIETIRTLTCLATYEDPITGSERVLYGEQAAQEYPDSVEFMLRSGLPEDDARAELAKKFFNELITAQNIPEDSVVVYAIPTIDNEAGLKNLSDVIEGSPIGEATIRSFPESLCGSIPAMGDELEAIDEVFVSINMGSTNLEACAYRHGEQLAPFSTGAVTGTEVDRRIANAVEEETQGRVNIDRTTAREYKEEHASFVDFEPFTDIIQQPGGGSHEFTVNRGLMDPVDEYVDEAVDEIANNFLSELANTHMKPYQLALGKPIALTGGMACIPGITDVFEERLSEELSRDISVVSAERPDLAAAEGAHRIAERLADNL